MKRSFFSSFQIRFFAGLSVLLALGCATHAAPVTPSTPLAANGKAMIAITTSPDASSKVKTLAATLAEYLGKISGAKFEVSTGDGKTGIALGTVADFPALALAGEFEPENPTRREEYLLRSHANGVLLIGATEQAVSHAVWDFLYRLGYRQFFPGPNWEVVPSTPTLNIAVNSFEKPDYLQRDIWYGFGALKSRQSATREWQERNRMDESFDVATGHAYESIISRHDSAKEDPDGDGFFAHPEYYALVHGVRKPPKFCISNPGLRALVVKDALQAFAARPERTSYSVEPSDGGGWCECDKCAAMGSISNRVVTLANQVAAAVDADPRFHGKKYIGMQAYSFHSTPPHIKLHPRIIVRVATHYGPAPEPNLAAWQKQGAAMTGIREYYSVNVWDRDVPGKARAANLDTINNSIKTFYDLGARFMSAEAGDGWGPHGLGYYLASRELWDTGEAARAAQLREDFLTKCFGDGVTKAKMDEFYALIDGANRPMLSTDLIGKMFSKLRDALASTHDPKVQARLYDLALYTHYLELYRAYSIAETDEELAARGEAVMRFGWRIQYTGMVNSLALWRSFVASSRALTAHVLASDPDKTNRLRPFQEPDHPWKNEPLLGDTPYTAEESTEISEMIAKGIAANPQVSFAFKSYGTPLVPAGKIARSTMAPGHPNNQGWITRRSSFHLFIWVEKPGVVTFKVRPGSLFGANKHTTEVELFSEDDPENAVLGTTTLVNNNLDNEISFNTPFAGLHRIVVTTHGQGAVVTPPAGMPQVFAASPEDFARPSGRENAYFYVPKGTKTLGFFVNGSGEIQDSNGTKLYAMPSSRSGGTYDSIAVPAGQDGKVWRLYKYLGYWQLLTVPPYLARKPEELMLPKEVVDAGG
jgi:hypothetical protein